MNVFKELSVNLTCLPLYWFSRLVPKEQDLWVFGAWFGNRYSDNPRYVYEYLNQNKQGIRAVWLSRDTAVVDALVKSGKEAYRLNSIRGFWLSCRAGAVFLCCGQTDVNLVGSLHALKVQLWHGIPLKKIKADDDKNRLSRGSSLFKRFRAIWMTLFPFDSERWDVLVTSGPEMSRRMTSAFQGFMARNGRVAELGNPRADRILAAPDSEVMVPFTKSFSVRKIVCYAPTFRGTSSTLDLFAGIDLDRLNQVLERWDALLLIKLHFYDRNRVATDGFPERVHFVNEDEAADLNLLLPHVDVLITDYSSVFFDYLLLDRPILFAPFDIETYLSAERGMYESYEDAVPGFICKDWGRLVDQMDATLGGEDPYSDARLLQRDRFFSNVDQKNSERVVQYVKSRLNS